MKIQITLILALLITGNFFAQGISTPVASANESRLSAEFGKEASLSIKEMATLHEKAATDELERFLNEHLTYPELVLEENLEGSLVIRVQLNKRGKIQQLTVVANELPAAFEIAALTALEDLNKITYGRGRYLGSKIIYVPVRFSF